MRKRFLSKRWTSRLTLAVLVFVFVGCRDEGKGVVDTPITDAEVFDALVDADSLVADAGVEEPLPDLGPDFGLGTPSYRLTVLHGGESGTRFRSPDGFGGVSRFIGVWDELVARADPTMNSGLVKVSVGGHIEAGRNHAASGALDGPSLSAAAVNLAAFDAVAVSARDFALGPDVFADLVEETGAEIVFVGSNVDVSQEARLAGFADAGRVAESAVVVTGASRVGIVSVTPDLIPSYTVPGEVTVSNPRAAVQGAVDRLTGRGVDKIVLLSPTDGPWAIELLSKLHHVDVVVTAARDAVALFGTLTPELGATPILRGVGLERDDNVVAVVEVCVDLLKDLGAQHVVGLRHLPRHFLEAEQVVREGQRALREKHRVDLVSVQRNKLVVV